MLDQIERLVRAGFAIHWLHPRSKRPIGEQWSEKPVASFAFLTKTFERGYNAGVRLGKWSVIGTDYLHVIDLDIRKPELEREARRKLSELLPGWEMFPIVKSGSGGPSRHVYFLSDQHFTSKKLAHSESFSMVFDQARQREVKKWDWEIELFGTGKQVVIPPSIHPDTGKPYRWQREFDFEATSMGIGPIVDAVKIHILTTPQGEEQSPPSGDDRTKPLGMTLEEAADVLAELPEPEYREDRDGWLTVGMALHHEFGGSDEAYKMWSDFSKLSEKFDSKDQRRVWKSFKGKSKPIRMATLVNAVREARLNDSFENLEDNDQDDFEVDNLDDVSVADLLGGSDFDDLLGGPAEPAKPKPVSKRQAKLNKADVEAQLNHVPAKVKRINARHAVAFINGKTVILTENRDGSVSYGTVSDLHNYYENDRVTTEKATEPVTKAWMRHKKRREYPNGVVFAPGKDVPDTYNLWRGFSVEPDPEGSCRLILAHLKRVICNNNERHFRYALGWCAHLIQRPDEKPGVAFVLRGKKGVGKDTIADYLGSLFPHHHVKIANREQLTGKFNAHQQNCLLLHVEEGFWAGNKNDEGPLKHLITTEKVFIEPKGLNGFHVASYLRLFMSSNEDWVVPATNDERRYFVLDVPATRKGDFAYFTAIRNEMMNGGKAALLHFLMNYDISDFNIRDVPETSALAAQKLQGLRNFERWWYGLLEGGDIEMEATTRDGEAAEWGADTIVVERDDLRDAYSRWMRSRRYDGQELRHFEIGKHLRALVPDLSETRKRIGDKREWHYVIPHLEQCRRSFEAWLGSELIWQQGQPVVIDEDDTEGDGSDSLA